MPLTPGSRLGAYEVVSLLGEGGMGQVYRATDTNLKRQVALKVLPASVAGDAERLARFQREAEVLAALNHPHIAQIFGFERSAPSAGSGQARTTALVMELVEGEDLSQRIARGAIPLDEALPIARQIAEALEAAHEQGIVHRDLKPANIKVRDDGTVKVLDFGLAKALDTNPASVTAGNSPTITSPAMTQAGMILGTAAYMSPEQAKGKAVDRRADIWAFGCVLYEMLTGRRTFKGDDVTDTLTAVLRDDPDWTALPPQTPAGVARLLRRCLERDVTQRLDSMRTARLDIEDARHAPASVATAPGRRTPWPLAVTATAAVALLAGWGMARWSSPAATVSARPASVSSIAAPPGAISAFHHGFALSPDGASLAFTARDAAGRRQIWIRRLDELTARPLEGTDGGSYPFWSPDGAHLGFFAGAEMRRVPATGGSVQTICAAPGGQRKRGAWSDGGQILFNAVTSAGPRMFKVDAGGGQVSRLDHVGYAPQWLPGGREFLFSGVVDDAAVVQVASTEGGVPRTVTEFSSGDAARFTYAEPGHLFSNRGGVLTVQALDPRTHTPNGGAVAIAGEAGSPGNWFSVSAARDRLVAIAAEETGVVGDPGDPVARLKWVDRQGNATGELGEPGRYWTLRLAPDGRRVAVNAADNLLWILGAAMRPVKSQETGWGAVWSPDGSEYVMVSSGARRWRKRAGSDTPATPLEGMPFTGAITDWSPDGRTLLVTRNATADVPHSDLVTYDLASRAVRAVVTSTLFELQGRFSPDGQRVAYTAGSSGDEEVYVRGLEPGAAAVPVGRGRHPSWRRDGRELFYLGPNDELMAVEMTRGSSQPAGTPRQLFRIPLNDLSSETYPPYDVTSDGQRFLLNVPDTPAPLLYIDGLQSLLATKRGTR